MKAALPTLGASGSTSQWSAPANARRRAVRRVHSGKRSRAVCIPSFSAQYQQSPIPPGGTIIKRKWLTTDDDVNYQSGDRIIMSWDIALSETKSVDYSACVVLRQRT